MASTGVRHIDAYKTEFLVGDSTGNVTTLYLDMALYSHVTFFVLVANGTSVTGAAVTLLQAQDVSATGSKALTYNNYFSGTGGYAAQTAASDVIAQTTGVSGTFTTATTASTNLLYAIEVHDTDLDLNNNFKTVALNIATGAANTKFDVIAHCYPRFGGKFDANPTALT